MSYDAKRDVDKNVEERKLSNVEAKREARHRRRLEHKVHSDKRELDSIRLQLSQATKKINSLLKGPKDKLLGLLSTSVKSLTFKVSSLSKRLSNSEKMVLDLSKKLSELEAKLRVSDRQKKDVTNKVTLLHKDLKKVSLNVNQLNYKERKSKRQLSTKISATNKSSGALGEAMSGNILFDPGLSSDGYVGELSYSIDISASELNDAYEGELKKELTASLINKTEDGYAGIFTHKWANFGPIVIASESAADPQISAPTVKRSGTNSSQIKVESGIVYMDVIFDTDAGVTKTYQAGDYLTITIKVSSDDKINGFYIEPLVVKYNVV